jgi:D-amino-acid dehydrogenase
MPKPLENVASNPQPSWISQGADRFHLVADETGDSAKFTHGLVAKISARGGEIRTGTTITGLATSGDSIAHVSTDRGVVKGDVYVLALGSHSPGLVRNAGIKLPIYPIKGYSLTIPIGNRLRPPTVASVDEHNLVAISRFGDRVRVTATAEFAGYNTGHKPSDFAFMKQVVQELYPDGADYDRAQMWGRPATHDAE